MLCKWNMRMYLKRSANKEDRPLRSMVLVIELPMGSCHRGTISLKRSYYASNI